MPSTDRELRVIQKRTLHYLLVAKESKTDLEKLIAQMVTEMDSEDVAHVEKTVAQIYGKEGKNGSS